MKPGLKFSNGDPLTAKDVEFVVNRILKINDPNGPASLLANMKSVKATNDSTVVFTLVSPNDQTFPFVLGTSAGSDRRLQGLPGRQAARRFEGHRFRSVQAGAGYQKNSSPRWPRTPTTTATAAR